MPDLAAANGNLVYTHAKGRRAGPRWRHRGCQDSENPAVFLSQRQTKQSWEGLFPKGSLGDGVWGTRRKTMASSRIEQKYLLFAYMTLRSELGLRVTVRCCRLGSVAHMHRLPSHWPPCPSSSLPVRHPLRPGPVPDGVCTLGVREVREEVSVGLGEGRERGCLRRKGATAALTSCSSRCGGRAGRGCRVCPPARPGSQTCT